MDGSNVVTQAGMRNYPLLFEMLRSFTTLADTLNLSHAVKQLGSTRQTVRRHIAQLEEIKGGALFDVKDRQYALSDLGARLLPEANDLVLQAESWVSGQSSLIDGLQYLSMQSDDGWFYYQQQHPMGKAFSSSSNLLSRCIRAWSEAQGEIEHEEMIALRPYCQIFRRSEDNWLFAEVGQKSSVSRVFGWKAARSAVGRGLGNMLGGKRFDKLANKAYEEVEASQGLRLDHCLTTFRSPHVNGLVPTCFERLLLGSKFADGSFALFSAVRLTNEVEIMGVSDDMLRLMPESFVMK